MRKLLFINNLNIYAQGHHAQELKAVDWQGANREIENKVANIRRAVSQQHIIGVDVPCSPCALHSCLLTDPRTQLAEHNRHNGAEYGVLEVNYNQFNTCGRSNA